MEEDFTDKYKEHSLLRKKHTDAILDSESRKRIIIAGPGTGKSFLFQEICKKNIKNGKTKNLTLSFINELVDDLTKDLDQLSEVKTLHSFALGFIGKEAKIFLNLGKIIEEDLEIIKGEKADYNAIFSNLLDEKEKLDFYSKRRKYYNFFSPNCSVYTLIKIFENGTKNVPEYSQILVDEFQDFNKLESKLLDYLSTRNPILIAGDDDQSLYQFKHANPKDIRYKYDSDEFESFQLPFCSRCTEVIIKAFNEILAVSKSKGFLSERTPKDYKYFPTAEKDEVSNFNNKILVKKNVYQKVVAFNIDKEIKKVFDPRKITPSVLIICPLKSQIADLEKKLREKGYKNIDSNQKNENNEILDGLNLIIEDSNCNLGWRIVSKYLYKIKDKESDFNEILKKSFSSDKKIIDLVSFEDKKYIKKILTLLRKVKNENPILKDELEELTNFINYNINEIVVSKIMNDIDTVHRTKNIYKNTNIKITTILGSKGLTRDYVFLVNFDDKYILEKNNNEFKTTNTNICQFLVSITRARIRNYIFTGENKIPTFVKWMNKDSYEEIE